MIMLNSEDHSEVLDVLGNSVFVEESLDNFDVLALSLFFGFSLVGSPGSPLGLGFELDGPWFFVVAVSGGALFIEAVEGEFLIVGDFLDSRFFSGVFDGFGSIFKRAHDISTINYKSKKSSDINSSFLSQMHI